MSKARKSSIFHYWGGVTRIYFRIVGLKLHVMFYVDALFTSMSRLYTVNLPDAVTLGGLTAEAQLLQ